MPKKKGREIKKIKAKKSRGGRGHSKGSAFERTVCRMLSLWWTGGSRDDVFWRTAGSGARATVRRGKGCTTANSDGDVCSLDPIGEPFTKRILVELKKGYTHGSERIDPLKMIDALEGRKSCLLEQWLDKAWAEAHASKRKEAWLIFQRDLARPMLMVRAGYLQSIEKIRGMMGYPYPMIYLTTIAEEAWALVRLQEFLGWFKPEQIK